MASNSREDVVSGLGEVGVHFEGITNDRRVREVMCCVSKRRMRQARHTWYAHRRRSRVRNRPSLTDHKHHSVVVDKRNI
jgi:hypothetical protein